MSIGKGKIAVLTSGAAGLVVGGVLMAAMPAFASTSSNAITGVNTNQSSVKAGHHPQWLKIVLHKNAGQIASDLHISKQQMFKDLSSGKSLDDIAADSNVSQSQLQSDMEKLIKSDLQARVSSHHMTATRETKLEKSLDAQLPKFMTNKHLAHKPTKFGAEMNVLNFVASDLKMTRSELVSKLKTGESIAQIATAKGVSAKTLQSDITQKLDTQINAHVSKLMNKTKWFQADPTAASGITTGN